MSRLYLRVIPPYLKLSTVLVNKNFSTSGRDGEEVWAMLQENQSSIGCMAILPRNTTLVKEIFASHFKRGFSREKKIFNESFKILKNTKIMFKVCMVKTLCVWGGGGGEWGGGGILLFSFLLSFQMGTGLKDKNLVPLSR